MDKVKRYVNLSFVFAAAVLTWFFVNLSKWAMGVFKIADIRLMGEYVTYSTVIGLVLAVIGTIILWRNPKIYGGAINVARETSKVTWPTFDETKSAMKVVVVTSVIVAGILFCFDFVAKELTALILGIN